MKVLTQGASYSVDVTYMQCSACSVFWLKTVLYDYAWEFVLLMLSTVYVQLYLHLGTMKISHAVPHTCL